MEIVTTNCVWSYRFKAPIHDTYLQEKIAIKNHSNWKKSTNFWVRLIDYHFIIDCLLTSCRVNFVRRHKSSKATGIGFGTRAVVSNSNNTTSSSMGLSGGVAIFRYFAYIKRLPAECHEREEENGIWRNCRW